MPKETENLQGQTKRRTAVVDFDGPNNDDNKNSVFLPEDLVEAVKRINSQQRAELLLKKPLT